MDSTLPSVFDSYYDMSIKKSTVNKPTKMRRMSLSGYVSVAFYQDCLDVINTVLREHAIRSRRNFAGGSAEMITNVALEDLFKIHANECAMKFLFFLINDPDPAYYIRNMHGVWMSVYPRGRRTVLVINRGHLNPIKPENPIILEAWKKHRVLAKVQDML